MKNLTVYIIVQKSCMHLSSCQEAMDGIKTEAKTKGYDPVFYELSSEDAPVFTLDVCSKVLVLGFTENWIRTFTEKFANEDIHVILVNISSPVSAKNISCINQDRKAAVFNALYYLGSCGRTKTALVGTNPVAYTDLQKKEAFLQYKKNIAPTEDISDIDVYESKGSILECCDEFFKSCHKYDSAICVNDMVGVVLIKKAKDLKINIPNDLYVIGYGNSIIGKFTSPQLTTFDPGYFEAGKYAVNIFQALFNMPKTMSLNTVIESSIVVRGSTGYHQIEAGGNTQKDTYINQKLQFGNDFDVKELLQIERLLNKCDNLDFCILNGLLNGKSKEQISMDIPIGISTFRYRMKKLYNISKIKSKEELLMLLKKYGIKL